MTDTYGHGCGFIMLFTTRQQHSFAYNICDTNPFLPSNASLCPRHPPGYGRKASTPTIDHALLLLNTTTTTALSQPPRLPSIRASPTIYTHPQHDPRSNEHAQHQADSHLDVSLPHTSHSRTHITLPYLTHATRHRARNPKRTAHVTAGTVEQRTDYPAAS
jgi:hypothetical protein